MACGKDRRWHFQDPKFKNFVGIMPLEPQDMGAFGALTFLPVHRPSKYHTMPLASSILSLMKSMPSDGGKKRKTNYLKTWSRRGWGGGGRILNILIAKEGSIFI